MNQPVRLNVPIEKSILGCFGHVIRRDIGNLEKGTLFDKRLDKRGSRNVPTRVV